MLHRPNYNEFLAACAKYVKIEQGDTNYEVAHGWVEAHWNDPIRVAGGVRILEETWNRAFYSRRGIFDMQQVVQAIVKYKNELNQLRSRSIETFSSADENVTAQLWKIFFEALRPRGRLVSPYVATAKALHLLVPSFFVPFDGAIAKNYGCSERQPQGYIKFQHLMASLACHILDSFTAKNGGDRQTAKTLICGSMYTQQTASRYVKTFAKLLDEYNWVTRLDRGKVPAEH